MSKAIIKAEQANRSILQLVEANADLEQSVLQVIAERDALEDAISKIYCLVTGDPPEWSSSFHLKHAIADIKDQLVRERKNADA